MQLPPAPSSDRPLVAQFCGNDPQLILKAARHVEHLVDAVDINLGYLGIAGTRMLLANGDINT